jgi:hypothetical protein
MSQIAPVRWKDGDTMLSFGMFAAVVLALLVIRITDPDNWVTITQSPPIETCAPSALAL